MWKSIRGKCVSFVVTFYTAFALTMLWDWFVTKAFRVEEIGYWNMLGLVFIINILSQWTFEMTNAVMWGKAMKMLAACIPEENRAETLRTIEKDTPSEDMQTLIADGIKVLGITIYLGLGWAVHTFFM